jgi:hypothetical protein
VDVQRGRRRWRWRHLERRHIGSGRSRPECGDRQAQCRPNAGGHKLLNSMTLPLSPLLLDPLSPVPCARKRSPHLARHAPSAIIRAGADNVGDGSTQSSPDCAFISRKGCAICRSCNGAVANLSHRCQRTGRFIGLASAENLSGATAHANAPARMAQI